LLKGKARSHNIVRAMAFPMDVFAAILAAAWVGTIAGLVGQPIDRALARWS